MIPVEVVPSLAGGDTLFAQDAESKPLLYTPADIRRGEADKQVTDFLAAVSSLARSPQEHRGASLCEARARVAKRSDGNNSLPAPNRIVYKNRTSFCTAERCVLRRMTCVSGGGSWLLVNSLT